MDSRLGQVDLHGHFFAHEDVGIARAVEERLELVELRAGEGRAFAALFALRGSVVGQARVLAEAQGERVGVAELERGRIVGHRGIVGVVVAER